MASVQVNGHGRLGKVSLGVDFGTTSGRVLVLDLTTGRELALKVVPYRHGVIEKTLPGTSIPLGPEWALQHPQDYQTRRKTPRFSHGDIRRSPSGESSG